MRTPLFADLSLAARIEAAERDLLASSVRASFERAPELADLGFSEPIAGGLAACAHERSPLNKIVGLGFAGAVDPDELEVLEQRYAARKTNTVIELSSLAHASVLGLLGQRGYIVVGFENVLGRRLSEVSAPQLPTDIAIKRSDASDYETWLKIFASAFIQPTSEAKAPHEGISYGALERILRDMAKAEGHRRYLASRAGEMAGSGCIRIDPKTGIAQLCGAATLPEHRRHGVQSALLGARLLDARRAGCEVAVVTTVPGSTSQHNVQRQGFELLYCRAILSKAGPQPEPTTDISTEQTTNITTQQTTDITPTVS